MKIGLIGAGFVGQAVLKELTDRGHQITLLVRSPEKVKAPAGTTVKKVDAQDASELEAAMQGLEVVVSAYNAGWTNPDLYADFLKGSRAILTASKVAGVPRLLVVGGAGSLYIAPGQQLVDQPAFPAEYKAGASAARDFLQELRQERSIQWTYFSPAIEMHPGTSGLRKGQYRTGLEEPVFDAQQRSVLSVEDLAVALADELEKPQFINQRFTAAY